jgi:hypothetical protein
MNNYNFFSSYETDLPFRLNDLKKWVKTKLNPVDDKTVIANIDEYPSYFNKNIIKVVQDNSGAFIEVFLTANVVMTQNNMQFQNELIIKKNRISKETPSSTLLQNLSIDNYFVKGGGTYKPPVAIYDNDYTVEGRNSVSTISYIFGTIGEAQVSFKPKCTKKHFHFNNCKVNFIGGSYKCNCSNTIVFNNNQDEHAHCSEFKLSDITYKDSAGNTQTLSERGYDSDNYSSSQQQAYYMAYDAAYTTAKSKKEALNKSALLKQSLEQSLQNTNEITNLALGAASGDTSSVNTAANTVLNTLIYEYYMALNENYIMNENKTTNKGPKKQLLNDTMILYKYNYLNMLNIISGIAILVGSIVVLRKNN